jgi:hypothetical protein
MGLYICVFWIDNLITGFILKNLFHHDTSIIIILVLFFARGTVTFCNITFAYGYIVTMVDTLSMQRNT